MSLRKLAAPGLVVGLVLGTIATPAAGQAVDEGFTLTVLHANDGESAMLPSVLGVGEDADLLGFACPDGAATPGFADLPSDNVHAGNIACGVELGIVNGRSGTVYDASGSVTRGQIASLVVATLLEAGAEVPAASEGAEFDDLDATHGDAVRRLEAADIVQGRSDDRFEPGASVTRGQLATILVGAYELATGTEASAPEGDPAFSDVAGTTHADNILAAGELGLLAGRGDGTFAPGADTRRDQAASLVVSLLGRVVGETVPAGGAARFVAQVNALQDAARAGDDADVVTVSSGDNFLPGPTLAASLEDDDAPFYDALVFLAANFDAMTIGNHEFDFGPEVFAEFVEAMDPVPFISANLDVSAEPELAALEDAGRIASSTVVERGDRRIGIIGATTEVLPSISSPRDVTVGDVQPAVQAEADALAADGVDIVILSSHLQDIDIDLELAGELSGVDAIIGGGGGEDLREDYPLIATDADGDDVPVVTTPGSYRDIGKLVLEFDADGDLTGVGDDSELQAVAPFGPRDEATVRDVEVPVAAFVAELAENVVATTEVPLDARTSSVRTRETNMGNIFADALLEAAQANAEQFGAPVADIALQNGGGIRSDAILPPGPITELDTFTDAPFSNFVSVTEIDVERLRSALERSVAALPSSAGQHGQWAGIRFEYDLDQQEQVLDEDFAIVTEGERIRTAVATIDGEEVEIVVDGETQPFEGTIAIASNDFTLRGGDAYPFSVDELDIVNLGRTYQQALRDLVEDRGTITAQEYPDLTVDADTQTRFGPVGTIFD